MIDISSLQQMSNQIHYSRLYNVSESQGRLLGMHRACDAFRQRAIKRKFSAISSSVVISFYLSSLYLEHPIISGKALNCCLYRNRHQGFNYCFFELTIFILLFYFPVSLFNLQFLIFSVFQRSVPQITENLLKTLSNSKSLLQTYNR
jgi:hypothetical protein